MKYIYYSLIIALSLFIIISCSTESTPIYQLTTNVEPIDAGTVSPASGEYEEGEEVSITATSNEHWVFDRWQGDHIGSSNPTKVLINRDKTITAHFKKREYPLTINTIGEGDIEETVIQSKTSDYSHGTEINLKATPKPGWLFTHWEGDIESHEDEIQFVVESSIEVTAVFKELYAGGFGTESDPFQIGTIEHLQNVHYYRTNSYFIQINDIDASSTKNWNSNEGFRPLEELRTNSVYDGNGYKVSNLYINLIDTNSFYIGLFRSIKGIVKNLNLENIEVKGDAHVAGLAGRIHGGTIENVHISGQIYSKNDASGGIASTVLSSAKIKKSSSSASVEGINRVGGVVGSLGINSEILYSYASGNVTSHGNSNYTGGLVGENSGKIIQSYASSNVSGWHRVGGLVGGQSPLGNIEAEDALIINSYSSGNVTGTGIYIGGLIGSLTKGSIKKSISIANIENNSDMGVFAGFITTQVELGGNYCENKQNQSVNCVIYSDDKNLDDFIIKLTTDEMQGENAISKMDSLDFTNIWVKTDGYPILRWQEE